MTASNAAGDTTSWKALTLDVALYEHFLEESDMNEDQRKEFLEALWSVVVGFVDLGFEIHPLQAATGTNPKPEASSTRKLVSGSPDVISSTVNLPKTQFNKTVDGTITHSADTRES